jgi:hypothetical protein
MVAKWQAGYDMVYAQRTVRDGESSRKKSTSYLFYRLIQQVSRVRIPKTPAITGCSAGGQSTRSTA